jgi:multidrug efflux pump subunit AcrA (membrane-fusion protein)
MCDAALRGVRGLALITLVFLTGSCGSSPSSPGEAQATITITSTGVSPKEVRIKAFGHVRFVNNDTRDRTIVSDPVNVHTQCPSINAVGLLRPGQSRETSSMHPPGTCGFHDHEDQVEAFRGRIVVE